LGYPWKGIVLNIAIRSVGVMEWRSDAEKLTRIDPPEAGKPELWDCDPGGISLWEPYSTG